MSSLPPAGFLDLVAGPNTDAYLVARRGPSIPGGLDLHVLGMRERVRRKRVCAGQRIVFARVPLGAHQAVFGVAATALAGHTIPIDALWGRDAAHALLEKLARMPDDAEATSALEHALADRYASSPPGATCSFVQHAAERLAFASVGEVSRQLGVSERHMRRMFQQSTGLSPKTFARLKRFDRAVRQALDESRTNWSGLAIDAGYYDQAHLIADFHAIAGMTPRKFMAEVRDRRGVMSFR